MRSQLLTRAVVVTRLGEASKWHISAPTGARAGTTNQVRENFHQHRQAQVPRWPQDRPRWVSSQKRGPELPGQRLPGPAADLKIGRSPRPGGWP